MNPLGAAGGLPQPLQNILSKRYVFFVDLSNDARRQYLVKAVLEKPSRRPAPLDTVTSRTKPQTGFGRTLQLPEAGTSNTIIQSSRPQSEVLHIVSAAQSVNATQVHVLLNTYDIIQDLTGSCSNTLQTPAPPIDADHNLTKDDEDRWLVH